MIPFVGRPPLLRHSHPRPLDVDWVEERLRHLQGIRDQNLRLEREDLFAREGRVRLRQLLIQGIRHATRNLATARAAIRGGRPDLAAAYYRAVHADLIALATQILISGVFQQANVAVLAEWLIQVHREMGFGYVGDQSDLSRATALKLSQLSETSRPSTVDKLVAALVHRFHRDFERPLE